ncbi:MAG: ABC transporter substrate-binding protein, partial [Campylobacteraceae bacterium]|nr:ABC transporter substrate-binding protein [Campylobacteraceae bacterium]
TKLLQEKKADIGFVQSGTLNQSDKKNIQSLASIYYEPLWIFYKNEGYEINYIIELIGKKISMGSQGSGTFDLSMQILNDNGINNSNSEFLNYNSSEAKKALIAGEIDALLTVISPNSDIVQELLSNPKINVLSIKRAQAYSRKYSYLTTLNLYEGTMDLYRNIPSNNMNLLAATANLVTREGIPHELIRLLLKKVKEVHKSKSLFAQENQFPNTLNLDTKINKEALKYLNNGDSWLESIFPYWIASNMDRLKLLLIPLLTLMFPLFKGVAPLYRWTMRSKIYKWYKTVNEIDKKIKHITIQKDLKVELENLETLQSAIQDHTNVPMSFMGEYYNLLMHVELIINKIKMKLGSIN